MPINKVIFGDQTLIDLTASSLSSADQIASGVTAFDRGGNLLTGTHTDDATYSITQNLTNVTSSNDDTKVLTGGSFYAALTPANGYSIQSITVMMGGVDITSQVFKPGVGAKTVTANGTYSAASDGLSGYSSVTVNVPTGGEPTGTKQISISSNGTTTEDVAAYADAEITVNVPNSYAASDEGKVVSNGALVSQTSDTVTHNGTVDTTLINSLTVDVSVGSGYTRYATGTYTPAETYKTTGNRAITTITEIGFTPTHFILAVNNTSDVLGTQYAVLQESYEAVGDPIHYFRFYTRYQNTSGSIGNAGAVTSWTTQSSGYLYLSNGTIYLRTVSNVILVGGVNYTWYAYE